MGSSDLYEASGRKPHASVNFITAHDGFTLHDLVSYNSKHNAANGEENRDGNDNNLSWNCGVEGPSDDSAVNALRARQKRNLAVSLLLSQGVPMLLAGDEIGHSQNGNNNAYCQDNEISWLNWELGKEQQQLYEFVARVIELRRQHPVFSRRRFLQEQSASDEAKEVMWLTPEGGEMTEQEWNQEFARCLGVYLAGTAIRRIDRRGQPVKDSNFLVLFNAHHEAIAFVLPQLVHEGAWSTVLDTALEADPFAVERYAGAAPYPLQGRSVALLVAGVDD
jgi:isoamylase